MQIAADDYASDATGGHTVEVCLDDACGAASLDDPFPFVNLDGLREQAETAVVVVVRDEQERAVMPTTLTATPARFKPGGEACQFSIARLRLSLAGHGTARVSPD